VPVPPGFRQVCPTAIPIRTRHLRELPRRSTSGDQRARVRGPSNGRVFLPSVRGTFPCFSRPVHELRRAHADVVPVLGDLWTSAVAGASPRGEEPVLVAGPNQGLRSDADPRRSTPSRRPGCLPPLRPRQASARRISPPNESCAPVPRSRRPHFLHWLWRGAFTGLASTRARSPAIPGIRGTGAFFTDGFDSFESLVPGTDDPSAPFGSTVVARLRELFALLVPTPVAAPRRLLRP
jgi:hypothetical protein